jgi:hypothetical protein
MPKRCFLIWFFNPFTLILSYLHGSYDIAVAFFILLGAFFLYKNSFLSAGLAFGLGTLAKTSPIYVALPLAGVLLFKRIVGSFRISWPKTNIRTFLRFSLGCIIPLAFFAPLIIEYVNLMTSGISKEIAITGGMNQWFFAADPHRADWINLHIGAIQAVFSYYPAIVLAIAVLFSMFLKFEQKGLLLLTTFFTNLIYFFLPITLQPQYLLWILPLFVVFLSLTNRFLWPLILYSVAGLFFYFSLQGPQIFLYPLATYTHLYPLDQLVTSVASYVNLPGLFSQNLRQDLCTIFGGLGFLGQLLTTVLLIKSLWMAKDEE